MGCIPKYTASWPARQGVIAALMTLYDLYPLQCLVIGYFWGLETCALGDMHGRPSRYFNKILAEVVRLFKYESTVDMALTVQMNIVSVVVSQNKKQKNSNILNNFLVVFCSFAEYSAYFYIIYVFHGCWISKQDLKIFQWIVHWYFSRTTSGICDVFPGIKDCELRYSTRE